MRRSSVSAGDAGRDQCGPDRSGTLTADDVDNPDNTFTPSSTVGTIGDFAIDAAGAWTFTANSPSTSSTPRTPLTETFNVTSIDGTASTVTITITGTNDAAVVSSQRRTLAETNAALTTGGTLTAATSTTRTTPSRQARRRALSATSRSTQPASGPSPPTRRSTSLNTTTRVTETFNVTSVDGTATTVTITITGTNDAAVVSRRESRWPRPMRPLTAGGTLTSG